MKNKYLWTGSIVGLVLVLDQWTKHLVSSHIRSRSIITVVPGFFNLTNVRNPGAAFGILAHFPGFWRSAFFITITVVAVAVIAWLVWKTRDPLLLSAYSLIAGGAVGNVIDRVRHGEVVDFIQWHVKSYYWPSFNIADTAISIGIGILAIDLLFRKERKPQDQ
jgi:signal peptidase II